MEISKDERQKMVYKRLTYRGKITMDITTYRKLRNT